MKALKYRAGRFTGLLVATADLFMISCLLAKMGSRLTLRQKETIERLHKEGVKGGFEMITYTTEGLQYCSYCGLWFNKHHVCFPMHSYINNGIRSTSSSILCCHWCGVSLSRATSVTYLNGNLPCCDLCLKKGRENNGGKGTEPIKEKQ